MASATNRHTTDTSWRTFRSSRISPDESLVYKDKALPSGTLVSQTGYFVHMDPSIFPNPDTFDPERWNHPAPDGKSLSTYLVAFGKGSRSCIGLNFAYAMLYLTIATIAWKFDLLTANYCAIL